jgi:hypothetical protein
MTTFRPVLSLILLVFCLIAGLGSSLPASAASPKADVWLGYSRLGSNTFYANVGGLNGWEGALNVKVKPFLGIEGDVSQYGWGAPAVVPHTTAVLFGPRLTVGALGIKFFVHGLAGMEHSANSSGLTISGSSLTYAGGGGVDLPIAPFFSWRVMADYIHAPTLSPAGSAPARYSTGLVFRF